MRLRNFSCSAPDRPSALPSRYRAVAIWQVVGNEHELTLYDRLGVASDADVGALRAAYHELARHLHPDLGFLDDGAMAEVNQAWRTLSDPLRRRAYDEQLRRQLARPGHSGGSRATPRPVAEPARGSATPVIRTPSARAPAAGARRDAWFGGIQLQIRRLGAQAARSAAQTLLLRHPGSLRADYDALIDPIVNYLLLDTEDRVRIARLAGAAPLDLANGAALLGLRSLADRLCSTRAGGSPRQPGTRLQAEMIDRMWDTMCHEIPRELALALGGNPRVARRLR